MALLTKRRKTSYIYNFEQLKLSFALRSDGADEGKGFEESGTLKVLDISSDQDEDEVEVEVAFEGGNAKAHGNANGKLTKAVRRAATAALIKAGAKFAKIFRDEKGSE